MKKLIATIIMTVIIACGNTAVFATEAIGAQNGISTLSDGFERVWSEMWFLETPLNARAVSVSNQYAQDGSTSLRVELNKSDNFVYGSKRSEIRLDEEMPLEEHLYTFYILLPSGGEEDYALDPKGSEIIAQWHNVPDANEEWTTPPLALRTFNGRYVIERCWDDAKITTSDLMTQKGFRSKHDLGSYIEDKGRFVKWSFRIKWGWLESQNPILEVYKDDVLVLEQNGLPNTTNDDKGNYFKLGIYKWDWAQVYDTSVLNKRVIYFDNIQIQ